MKKVILGLASILGIAAVVGTSAAEPAKMDRVAIGSEPSELAACQKVDILVNNAKGVKIKALKVDYETVEDGKLRTEDFGDTEVGAKTTKTVASDQDLQYIEGHTMKRMILHYKAWCGGKWSVEKTETDTQFDSAKCNSNSGKGYRVDLSSADPC